MEPTVVFDAPESLRDRNQIHAEQQAQEAARIQLRRKYRAAKTILDTPVGTTAAQVRQAVVEHRNILGGLIEILKDSGLVLDDPQ